MDEKDLEIQRLRMKVEQFNDFLNWMAKDGFGPEQFEEIMNAYNNDRLRRLN